MTLKTTPNISDCVGIATITLLQHCFFAIRFGMFLKRLMRLESISKQINNATKLIVRFSEEW